MLNRRVLVLNRYWVAVHICTARRAMNLLFQRLARVVTDDYEAYDFEAWRKLSNEPNGHHPAFHTPNFRMRLPQVLGLNPSGESPPPRPKAVWLRSRSPSARRGSSCTPNPTTDRPPSGKNSCTSTRGSRPAAHE